MSDVSMLKSQFDENGYLHVASAVDPVWCDKLVSRMRDLVAMRVSSGLKQYFEAGEEHHTKDTFLLNSAKNIAFFYDPKAQIECSQNNDPFRTLNKVGHALHDRCPVYQKFSYQEKFFDLMKALGQKVPKVKQSMFIFKQPKFGDAVPAHQDASFIFTRPDSTIGLWFALEDADENNGCLWVLPKSHRGPLKNRFARTRDGIEFIEQKSVEWPRDKFIPMPAKKGDMIVLHGFCPHLSEQNRSSRTRFAYTLHFIDEKAYFPKNNWIV